VLQRFHLHPDDGIKVSDTSKSYLVGEGPAPAVELLGARVELSTPISQRKLTAFAKTASSVEDLRELERLSTHAVFKSEVLEKRASVLNILEDFPSTRLPFAAYLDMLKPISPRQYSISSAPVAGEAAATANIRKDFYTASIAFDKVEAPARSGNGRVFHGVASTA
jgi:cytochrome P450/NADPH-cytochrome P450 reductase